MIQGLYVVHDAVAEEYSAPMMFPTDKAALRSFKSSMERLQKDVDASACCEDYTMYKVGKFDTEKGEIDIEFDDFFACFGKDFIIDNSEEKVVE